MKIVDRKTFLSLLPGTVYCKYESLGNFGALKIKHTSWPNDWWYSDLHGSIECDNSDEFMDKMVKYEMTGEDFRFDLEVECRDGLYEEDQLFAVYDPFDIQKLINELQASTSIIQTNGSIDCRRWL